MPIRPLQIFALLILAGPGSAFAQAPRIDATYLALQFIQGRFVTPVTCLHPDGSRFEREEAIVVRLAPQQGGDPMSRITFFGIDAGDAQRCYNLLERDQIDRRGVLYVTYRSHRRSDLGMKTFRKALARGPLPYPIIRGHLQERPIGSSSLPPRQLTFDGAGAVLRLGEVLRGSDAYKLLSNSRSTRKRSRAAADRAPRRLIFEIEGPEPLRFTGYYIEDLERRR